MKEAVSNLVKGKTYFTCRNKAKICGKNIFMIRALSNNCQIMTKDMHMLVCCRNSWDDVILVNDNILEELKF